MGSQGDIIGVVAMKLIVVEGIDGTGKTTLARSLQESLGFRYLYLPQPPFSLVCKEVEIMRQPANAFLLLFGRRHSSAAYNPGRSCKEGGYRC